MTFKVVTKSSKKLNVRELPSIKSRIVGTIKKDKIYEFDKLSPDGAWAYLNGVDISGWCSMEYLRYETTMNHRIKIEFTRDELEDIKAFIDTLMKEGD